MSSASALDNEDLENVPSIRMEDVQPRRDTIEVTQESCSSEDCDNVCTLDNEYNEEYVIRNDDDDSNIGSMVSIHSEEVVWDDSELIIPDIIDKHNEVKRECNKKDQTKDVKLQLKPVPDSWPTLEILPGGIIKNADKFEDTMYLDEDFMTPKSEMIYACAKCPQKFKYLFCLVEHVKVHSLAKKKPKITVLQHSSLKKALKEKPKYIAFVKVSKQKTRKVPKKSIAYV